MAQAGIIAACLDGFEDIFFGDFSIIKSDIHGADRSVDGDLLDVRHG